MFQIPPARFTTGPALLFSYQPLIWMPPLSQLTVPALVKVPDRLTLPLMFSTPLVATLSAPPEYPYPMLPVSQFNVPLTVLLPRRVMPLSVRLVMLPP